MRASSRNQEDYKKSPKIYGISIILTLFLTGSALSGCMPRTATIQAQNGLVPIVSEDLRSVWANPNDRQTAQDIAEGIRGSRAQTCSELQTACQFPVVVEIYPNQASFDQFVINPDTHGFFAISGYPFTIQMVSPANPAPHEITYEDGILVALHEYTRLALDEINPMLPTWLDEGTAIYISPHEIYTAVCILGFPFEKLPSFQELEENYYIIPAADLFAFTVVEFIIDKKGLDTLNTILRSPDSFESILQLNRSELEEEWIRYLLPHCNGGK